MRGASSRLEGGASAEQCENSLLVDFRDIGLRVPGHGAMWVVGAPRAVHVRDVELLATRRPFSLRKSKSWDMKRGGPKFRGEAFKRPNERRRVHVVKNELLACIVLLIIEWLMTWHGECNDGSMCRWIRLKS